jgi:hypothetical protein
MGEVSTIGLDIAQADMSRVEIPHRSSLLPSRAVLSFWVDAQEGLAAPHQIQNDSGLTQGLARRSAAG